MFISKLGLWGRKIKLNPLGVYSCDQVVTLLDGWAHVHLLVHIPFFYYKFCFQIICNFVFIFKIGLRGRKRKLLGLGVYSCDQVVTLLEGWSHFHLLVHILFFYYEFCSHDICMFVFISKIGLWGRKKQLHTLGVYSCDQFVTLLAGWAHVHLLVQIRFFLS